MPLGNFKVKPVDQGVNRALERLRDIVGPGGLKPALQNAAAELTRRIQYRFAFKRDPDGVRWAPWSPRTLAINRGQKRTLMLNTRQLRDNTRFEAGTTSLRAVIGMPYGVYHEQPGGSKGQSLPRRAFLFSMRNGKRSLAKSDEAYLLNAIRYQIRKATS